MHAILNLTAGQRYQTPDECLLLNSESAQGRSLHRVVQALLREGFLNRMDIINDGPTSWLPLWGKKKMLRIEGLHLGRAGHCTIDGDIALHQGTQKPSVISDANDLLSAVLSDDNAIASENLQRLYDDIANSIINDIACH